MYTSELLEYCERYQYTIVDQYTTYGEENGPHHRAIVWDETSSERYYLYYDSTRRRPTQEQQKLAWEAYVQGELPPPMPKQRGWRNTTLDNRRRKERQDRQHGTLTDHSG